MKIITDVWEFVETYYPNYSACDEILRNNDLQKQIEEGEQSEEDLKEQLNDSNAYIYGKAIEGYIESLKYDSVELAKQVLKENGYYSDLLWTIDDVKSKYNCTNEEAQKVLHGALNNGATMEQIWFAIDTHAEEENLKKIATNIFSISGYFKDDKSEFQNYLVYTFDGISESEEINEEDIFFFGLSEEEIKEAIKYPENSNLDFVITSYKKL